MIRTHKRLLGLLPLLLLLGALAACAPGETPTPCPPTQECPPSPTCPPPPPTPTLEEEAVEIPLLEEWSGSGHADAASESFTHWDEDDPPEVPTGCAKCHSAPGYKDFLGVDGTEAGVVNNAAEIGTVVNCTVCHNDAASTMTAVTFPSGIEVTGLGREATCYQCHQGRASTQDVNAAIEEAGVDPDTVSEELGFVNIHYYAAAATRLGTWVDGGFQYDGKSYDRKFHHVESFDTCVECHEPHSLELRVGSCSECHPEVESAEDLRDSRLQGSTEDYDGDGNIQEGIYYEIQGLQEVLLGSMQTYASEVAGTPIVYDSVSYPYFFIDTNENGEADEDEVNFGNQYASWTPRLLKAAYNYQTSFKDPGNYAHGGKYHIELLYDSVEDLDAGMAEGLTRTDSGHFDGSSESFRHWDEDGEVPGACSKCHSSAGLPVYLEEGVNVSQPIANGLQCRTCHDAVPGYSMYPVDQVTFPSGAALSFGEEAPSNICLECHQGRQSTVSVREANEGLEDDTVAEGLGFINVHYFASGATVFGGEALGAYQYEGQTYVGELVHPDGYDECTECHTAHGLNVRAQSCLDCHPDAESAEDLEAIRTTGTDFDGDGDVEEGVAGEIETLHQALYTTMQAYAEEVVGTGIVHDPDSYPYFFVDTNGNGEVDPDEANFGNQYGTWTPRLLRGAYNYQYVAKDPGAYTHNPMYIIQVLQDSLGDLGDWATIELADLTRPQAEE